MEDNMQSEAEKEEKKELSTPKILIKSYCDSTRPPRSGGDVFKNSGLSPFNHGSDEDMVGQHLVNNNALSMRNNFNNFESREKIQEATLQTDHI